MSYTRCIYYIFILGHFAESLCGSAEKLTKEEFSALLPQRNKLKDVENHFPNQPELPDSITDKEIFYLISNANDSYDEEIMAKDALALPLGAQESDFNPVTYSQNNQDDDDAVIIEAGDPLEGDFFEGDIYGVKLTSLKGDGESESSSEGEGLDSKNAIKNTFQKWPSGEIPYVISNSFGSHDRSVIRAATDQFSRHSCVKWRPHVPTDIDYVHILRDVGCYSRVGRTGGEQILSLGYGCVSIGTVVHEMLHAAGFWHEQSRPDRDQHVSILWENISPGREDNFARYSRAEVSTLSLPYDTQSVMHYSANAFSRNGQYTITPLKTTNKISALGQRKGFSQLDVEKLNKLYQCQNLAVTLVPDPYCKDQYDLESGLCQSWMAKGGCKSYPNFMKDYCPRSCDLCPLVTGTTVINPVTSNCTDQDRRCPAWAAYANQCQSNRLFMSKKCKQTCGLCNSLEDNLPSLESMPSASSAIVVGLNLNLGHCFWLGMGFLVSHFLTK